MADEANGAEALLQGAKDNLMQLMQMMGNQPEKAQLASVLEGLSQFEASMSEEPSEAPKQPATMGITPVEAGAKDVKPAF